MSGEYNEILALKERNRSNTQIRERKKEKKKPAIFNLEVNAHTAHNDRALDFTFSLKRVMQPNPAKWNVAHESDAKCEGKKCRAKKARAEINGSYDER